MCITLGKANMGSTMVYTHASSHMHGGTQSLHVTAYQNAAVNLTDGPNCMVLHFPASSPELVRGPENTQYLMQDIMQGLPSLAPLPAQFRGRGLVKSPLGAVQVEHYGDYHVVIAENAHDMIPALRLVPETRRPQITSQMMAMIDWYDKNLGNHFYLLACFDGQVKPRHPIVVSYVPHNDDVLFAPGLDGHDGTMPEIGQLMKRDFKVAYSVDGVDLPHPVVYRDSGEPEWWAPRSVVGFYDNREQGPNTDYVVPLLDIQETLDGRELVEDLVV